MKAVVVGGSGQVGSWLLEHLAAGGHEAVGTYRTVAYPGLAHLDTADAGAGAWIREQRPDVVFYPAGFTWVDGCERDPDRRRQRTVTSHWRWPGLRPTRGAVRIFLDRLRVRRRGRAV